MQTTNIRNLYHLSSHKIVLFVFLILCATPHFSFGQDAIRKHDAKKNGNGYSYGIHLALTNQNFRIERSTALLNSENILAVDGKTEPGVSIGIIGALHPSERSEIRATALVNFNNQNLVYTVVDEEKQVLFQGSSTAFELPVHYKYKSKGYGNFRMFALGGGRFRTNFSAYENKDVNASTLQLSRNDVLFDLGAGAEIHFPFFTLSPTLTVSQGFRNQRQPNEELEFATVLSGLYSRVYTLSFNIE